MEEIGTREPVRYAWMRDGLLVAGTLCDYAKMWEGDYYAGEDDLTRQLLTWDGKNPPALHDVKIVHGDLTENDYIPYTISIPSTGETHHLSIDGRS